MITTMASDATCITDCQALLAVVRAAGVVASDPRSSLARVASLVDAIVRGDPAFADRVVWMAAHLGHGHIGLASKSDGSVALVNCGRASSAVPSAAENRSSRALTATAPSAAAAEEEEPSELALRRGARNATTSATPPARAKPASPREDCSTAPV